MSSFKPLQAIHADAHACRLVSALAALPPSSYKLVARDARNAKVVFTPGLKYALCGPRLGRPDPRIRSYVLAMLYDSMKRITINDAVT